MTMTPQQYHAKLVKAFELANQQTAVLLEARAIANKAPNEQRFSTALERFEAVTDVDALSERVHFYADNYLDAFEEFKPPKAIDVDKQLEKLLTPMSRALRKYLELVNAERETMGKVNELLKEAARLDKQFDEVLEALDEVAADQDPDSVIFTYSFHEGAHEVLDNQAAPVDADEVLDALFDTELVQVDTSKAADETWTYATQQE